MPRRFSRTTCLRVSGSDKTREAQTNLIREQINPGQEFALLVLQASCLLLELDDGALVQLGLRSSLHAVLISGTRWENQHTHNAL